MRRILQFGSGLFSTTLFSLLALAYGIIPQVGRSAPNWVYVGPKSIDPPFQFGFGTGKIVGRANSAAYDPFNANTFYVASPGGGVFKTIDGGTHWVPLSDGWPSLATSCVAVDPANPNTIYAGTGDYDGSSGAPIGIMKSTDGGATWRNLGQGQLGGAAVRRILIDPENPQILIAINGRGPAGVGQVYRSGDGGSNWTPVLPVNASWSDVVYSAKFGNSRYYYVAASGSSTQLWRSADRGLTWIQLNAPFRSGVSLDDTIDIAASPADASTLYVLGSGDRKVWKTTNAGFSWTEIAASQFDPVEWDQSTTSFTLSCSRANGKDVVYVGLGDLFQSVDGGANWRSYGRVFSGADLTHSGQHDIVINPADPNRFLVANEGGLYESIFDPAMNSWGFRSLNDQLPIAEISRFSIASNDETKILASTRSNGTFWSTGDLDHWVSLLGGSGSNAIIDWQNPTRQFATFPYLGGAPDGKLIGVNRTANEWFTHSLSQVNTGSDQIDSDAPAVQDPIDPDLIYLATNYLYRYQDSLGGVWTSRLGNQRLSELGAVTALTISRRDHQVIYSGSSMGEVFRSSDAGQTWSRIDHSVFGFNRIRAISVSDQNAADVLVTAGGKLWRCSNAGQAVPLWDNVSGQGVSSLPSIEVGPIARDPFADQSTWYVGTGRGVFRTKNQGSTWEDVTQPLKLPAVRVTDFQVRNGFLYAATLGRGLWRLQISTEQNAIIGFQAQPDTVVGPSAITLTVQLASPAPSGGAAIALDNENPALMLPRAFVVPGGATTATTEVRARQVATPMSGTLTASYNGSSRTVSITVLPNGLYELALSPSAVTGGQPSQGTVRLGTPAGPGGTVVTLQSQNVVVRVPTSLEIPEGETSATFICSTDPVASDTDVEVTASTLDGTNVQSSLRVKAPQVTLFAADDHVVGGQPVGASISLDGVAPSGGLPISVQSSNPSALSVSDPITVPSGASRWTGTWVTYPVSVDTPVTVTATLNGRTSQVSITVEAQRLSGLTFNPASVVGGSPSQGTVELRGPASAPVTVTLLSTNGAVATVPQTVTIPVGQSSASFQVNTSPVTADTPVSIRAIYGTQSLNAVLTVSPLRIESFTLLPSRVYEGQSVVGTVTLNGTAPSSGFSVSIQNTNSAVGTLPSSLLIASGKSNASFTFVTKAVSTSQTATVRAVHAPVTLSQTLTVSPIDIQSVSLGASYVTGGGTVPGVVNLVAPAPAGGAKVSLSSSNPGAASVPATVTIPAGRQSATFTVTSKPVSVSSIVVISASRGTSQPRTTMLQVMPPEVTTFTLSKYDVRGGTKITGTVRLDGKAPQNGMIISITATPNLVHPLATIKVPKGATSINFSLNTDHVNSVTQVAVTARTVFRPVTVQLTLRP